MKKISLTSGVLRTEVVNINNRVAEVTIRGNLICDGHEFRSLPILRLAIENFSTEDYCDVRVDDEYYHAIPYLKPIKAFREFIKVSLLKLQEEINDRNNLVHLGIKEYLFRLKSFSEVTTLVREVKSQVNMIKPEKVDAEDMRRILEILGRTSAVDNHFEVIEKEVSK